MEKSGGNTYLWLAVALATWYNDDFTTMDFVVEILMTIFHKEHEEAVALMMLVHNIQRAVVGTYSYDIARTKAEEAEERAREQGFPFRLSVEEA